jgi:DnaJ family protein C protein 1
LFVLSFVSANDRRSPIAKLEPTGERHLIDASTATRPSIGNTWFLALIKSLVQKFTGNKPIHTTHTLSSPGAQGQKRVVPPDVDSDDASSGTGSDGPGSDASTSRRGEGKEKTPAATRMGPTVKAGGMRRKVKRR